MSFEPPAGILDIGNATLRVGKLEVAETSGLNQGLQNIVKNDLLITETTEYTTNRTWGLKLPTTWVGEFEVKGQTGRYVEFNFYNEGSTSNAQGYTLNFKDTSLTLKYDNGSSTLASATIPTIVGTYRKVNIFFERNVVAVSIDGTRYLYDKRPSVLSRVISTTGSAFLNAFFESDHGGNSGFKNLRIVNGRFISDETSNIAFVGGNLGVGVNSPKEALDIRGNMHFNRVSNVSSVSVDSNVVTEYTGPHDRPLRKYPEVKFADNQGVAGSSYTQDGYTIEVSSTYDDSASYGASHLFNGIVSGSSSWTSGNSPATYDSNGDATSEDSFDPGTGPVYGSWIDIKLPKKIRLSHFIIHNRESSSIRSPINGILWAKDKTSSTWYRIHDFSGLQYGTAVPPQTFLTNETTKYDQYRLQITKMASSTSSGFPETAVAFSEWELYGYEEGSGSIDTTLKSVYNVPATTGTQLEVYYDAKDLTAMPSTVTDLAGGDQNGTPGTGVTVADGAFVFDGTANGKIVGTHNLSGTAPVNTCSAWFKKVSSTGNYSYISRFGTNATSSQIAITIDERSSTLNKLRFEIYGAATALESELTITENVWYHVAGVYSGGTWNTNNCKLYLNGVEISLTNSTNTTTTPSITDTTLVLGSDGNSNSWDLDGSIANFRLYSKALNADQVKELYDYQKDYFLGSKSQVTLYKGHLGVGVTEPSGQLELAGDERLQEYPPGPMSDYDTYIPGHGVFRAYAPNESNNSNNPFVWKAFNKETSGTKWWFEHNSDFNGATYQYGTASDTSQYANPAVLPFKTNGVVGLWIELKMPYAINLKKYALTARAGDALIGRRMPEEGVLFGSNDDGTTWTAIHNHKDTGGNYEGDIGPRHFNVNDTSKSTYSYFRFVTTKLFDRSGANGTSGETPNIGELKFFGTPGPTTLDKGSLSLTRSLDVPRVSRYEVDTETPRPEKLVVDLDTTVNSSPTDISGKGNHGTFYNGAYYSAVDKAFVFDGSDDVIDINLPSEFVDDPILTISMWVNPITLATASGQYDTFIHIGKNSDDDQIQLTYYGFDGHLQIGGYGQGMKTNDASAVPIGQWTHICAVITPGAWSTTTKKLYINGEFYPTTLSGSGTSSIPAASSTSRLVLGGVVNLSGGYSHHSHIKMSNPKLYNVALEPSEVKKLYNLGRTGRSMVISDTAVGIGKAPEAQLDVRGTAKFAGAMTVQGQTRLTNFVAMGSGTNSTTRLFVDDPIVVKTWNAYNNNTSAGEYTFEAKATTLVHFHYSSGEDVNISESYLVTCADNGSPGIVQLKNAGYLYYSVGHGSRIVRFYANALPSNYNSSHFFLRISAIWKMS